MNLNPFDELVGEELFVVGFSLDGLHFRFSGPDGPELRADPPRIKRGTGSHHPDEAGYNDALMKTLGAHLEPGFATDEKIELGFDDGTTLTFSLERSFAGTSIELAELHTYDGLWTFPLD